MTGSYVDQTTLNRVEDRLTRQIRAAHDKIDGKANRYLVTITVPVLRGDLTTDTLSKTVHAYVEGRMRDLGGGGESHRSISGTYVMDDGSVARDESIVYETFTSGFGFNEDTTMRYLAQHVGRELRQESVLWTYSKHDGGVCFTRPDDYINLD